jgi:uncharacterized damage-inducible protein DinB
MISDSLSASEYNQYYKRYIDRVPTDSVVQGLQEGLLHTLDFFKHIPDDKQEFRYQPEKWTPKEILLHLVDTERVFAYRALQFARAKDRVVEGFDQDEFVANSNANSRSMDQLLAEYQAVRLATLQFAKSCSEETLLHHGVASNSPLSVRAALYIVTGHEIHHRDIIKERYL